MTPGHLSGEQDWPVLTLEFNNALHHYQDMDPDDGFQHDPSEYETYHPESAPNVLSKEECALLDRMTTDGTDDSAANARFEGLLERLADYAKEQQ